MTTREKTCPVAQARWRRDPSLAETDASDPASAACYCRSEDVRVVPVIMPELELSNVQRQIFGADLVERADDAALEDAPEAFNRVRMDSADDILAGTVLNRSVVVFVHAFVEKAFVGCEQAHLVADHLPNELLCALLAGATKDASNDVALAFNRADNDRLTRAATTVLLVVRVSVPVLAADIGLINLNDAHKLAEAVVLQCRANAMTHVPSGFIRSEAHEAVNLPRADTLLARKHKVDNAKPLSQIDVRVLENRADKVREAVSAADAAVRALPLKLHGLERIDLRAAATRARDALRPAPGDQIGVASVLIREHGLELADAHLHDLLWLSGADHNPTLLSRSLCDTKQHNAEESLRQVGDHRLRDAPWCGRE